MAAFTTEAAVRLKFQAADASIAPADLINESIDHAHELILRRLDPQYDTTPAPDGVILGETLLAGARMLRSIASKDALDQRSMTIGGQRIEAGRRFSTLMAMASEADTAGWEALEPFLLELKPRNAVEATDTTPVLGEE